MTLFWAICNAVLSGALAAMLSYILVAWGISFNLAERIGMGLIGGSVILTIAPLLVATETPFDGWSTALLRLGGIIFFSGYLYRRRQHWLANRAMKRSASRRVQ